MYHSQKQKKIEDYFELILLPLGTGSTPIRIKEAWEFEGRKMSHKIQEVLCVIPSTYVQNQYKMDEK